MAGGVDGTVKIDTSIDDKSFNAGMKKLTASAAGALNKVLLPLVKLKESVGGVLSGLMGSLKDGLKGLLAGLFVALALNLGKILAFIRESIQDAMMLSPTVKAQVEELQHKWEELKASIGLAFLPLVTVALPYIKIVMDWLIKTFNLIAQITAAFLGQKQVLQVIPGSAAKLAKETEKTKKNAQGALAAFDQINVLAKQQDPSNQTATTDAPTVAAQMVPIADDILQKVQAIKDEIAEWFADPIGKIKETWGKIVEWFKTNVLNPLADWWNNTWLGQLLGKLWENFKSTWGKILANAKDTFVGVKDRIIQAFNGVKEFLTGVFTGDWELIWQGLKDIVAGVFGALWALIKGSINAWIILFQWLKAQLTPIINGIWEWMKIKASEAFNNIKVKALEAWNNIKAVWGAAVGWFTSTVINPLRSVFENLLNWIGSAFRSVFDGVYDYVIAVIDGIIVVIGGMFNNLIAGFNSLLSLLSQPTIPESTGSTGSSPGNHTPPGLATGAVLPPNAPFLAMLGDQRSGTNIEAPAALLQEMLNQAVAAGGGGQEVTIRFTGTGADIARMLKPHIDKENSRVGKSLRKE